MTKRSGKVKNLDTREIIDQNSRLIDALKNLNNIISSDDRKVKIISEFTKGIADSMDIKDET
jgi:hypothetical protein